MRTLDAKFIGNVKIPGHYEIISSAHTNQFIFWIIQRDAKSAYELWRIDLESGFASQQQVTDAPPLSELEHYSCP